MDFSAALTAMKAGCCVTRTSWVEPDKYLYWHPAHEVRTPDGEWRDVVGYPVFVRPHKGTRGTAEPMLPTFDGLAAQDWEIVEE